MNGNKKGRNANRKLANKWTLYKGDELKKMSEKKRKKIVVNKRRTSERNGKETEKKVNYALKAIFYPWIHWKFMAFGILKFYILKMDFIRKWNFVC